MLAKTRDVAITSTDLTKYLQSQDDFNLELFVYHTAKKLGYHASHGGTYEDPITKARQYDVRAHILGGDYRVDFAIECKSLNGSASRKALLPK